MHRIDRLVCVDWGKDNKKRQAWAADVGYRRVAPLALDPCDLDALVADARKQDGRTVIAIDAALGVPSFYFQKARGAVEGWGDALDFRS